MNSGTRGKLAVGRVKFFGRHRGEVNSSAFSPDGQRLLTASEDGCVYGWETQSGRLLWRLGGHKGPVRFCRFSPDGRLFASTSCDRTIRLWDAADAKCLQVLKGHQRSVETVSFSHDSKQLASGGWDKRVMLWEVQERVFHLRHCPCTHLVLHSLASSCSHLPRPWKTTQPLRSIKLARQARMEDPGSDPSEVELSETQGSLLQSGQVLRHFVGHRDSVQSSDFAPSSDCLATGSWDSTIRMWDLRAGTPGIFHQKLEGHRGNISCLCHSPSGLLASGSWDKTIHIWKPSTRSVLIQLKGHITWVKSIAFSPDEQQLASAGYSHMVKVWDCNTGKCTETLKGVLNVAHACAFMPDGKLLVSGAVD